jgi:hypothetical protein
MTPDTRRSGRLDGSDRRSPGAYLDVPRGNPEPLDPFEAAIVFAIREAAMLRHRRMQLVDGGKGGRTA